VEALAALLSRETPGPVSPLVPFGGPATGGAAPFFCVHPVGGNVLCYAELARLLGAERPFYGLQARGLDGAAPPRDTVEAMAAGYVEAIRSVQPAGPYFLGGWSLGGVIAYEMARQLRERGEQVALVALIDAYVPTPEPHPLNVGALFARDLLGTSLAGVEPERLAPDALLETAVRAGLLPPGTSPEHGQALFRVFEANLRAARRYEARPGGGGRVVLFKARDAEGLPEDGGWTALVGAALERHLLPGDHYSLLRAPGVRELAERLREALERAK
jgi:thioesterase domain-containing protein